MAGVERNAFLAEVLATRGGANVLQCYQCGTCSGACPVIAEMQHGPRRLLYMIQSGMEEEVLASPDIWRCVSCYSCMNRCPRDIEITDLMADLRRIAIKKGYVGDKEAIFGQAFAETVVRNGRLFEPELLTRYYLRALDIGSLLAMVPLGLKMLAKGKIPLIPERIREPEVLSKVEVVAPSEDGKPDFVSSLVTVMTAVLGFVGAFVILVTGKGKESV